MERTRPAHRDLLGGVSMERSDMCVHPIHARPTQGLSGGDTPTTLTLRLCGVGVFSVG